MHLRTVLCNFFWSFSCIKAFCMYNSRKTAVCVSGIGHLCCMNTGDVESKTKEVVPAIAQWFFVVGFGIMFSIRINLFYSRSIKKSLSNGERVWKHTEKSTCQWCMHPNSIPDIKFWSVKLTVCVKGLWFGVNLDCISPKGKPLLPIGLFSAGTGRWSSEMCNKMPDFYLLVRVFHFQWW